MVRHLSPVQRILLESIFLIRLFNRLLRWQNEMKNGIFSTQSNSDLSRWNLIRGFPSNGHYSKLALPPQKKRCKAKGKKQLEHAQLLNASLLLCQCKAGFLFHQVCCWLAKKKNVYREHEIWKSRTISHALRDFPLSLTACIKFHANAIEVNRS